MNTYRIYTKHGIEEIEADVINVCGNGTLEFLVDGITIAVWATGNWESSYRMEK